jgi:pyridoxal phosphate enzyme (YggS family)
VPRAEEIAAALERARARVADAARDAGRPDGEVRLVAVSKKMPASDVQAALAAGQRDFGENYAQELRDKRSAIEAASPALPSGGAVWHFIGPLQANKVKYVAGKVALIHSVDSAALLEEIDRRAAGAAAPQSCLIQVNLAGEERKRGLEARDLPALLDRFAALSHVRCEGLMLIPPFSDDQQAARPLFAELRRLRDAERRRPRPGVDLVHLSMGMSHDFEIAIAEGATLVRVGTAIFGERPRT